ncbi:MAG: hypothetical protein CVU91_08570 [Firmicutes bacterium HGW-Firmicutes-16]|nr:MAG: hypothetical protein CVU91_08570 [Firmicutes bacterium HGW-Firmicutes-16]
MLGSKIDKNGFTLIELIVTLLIIGVLSAVLVPSYIGYIDKGKAASDGHSLGVLNETTRIYYAADPSPNLFEAGSLTDAALMQVLVDEGILPSKPTPKLDNNVFVWYASNKCWLLIHEISGAEITLGTGGFSGYITGTYTGAATELTIPKTLDGEEVLAVYQDVFIGKGLTSVTFPADSGITRIHARAFKDNKLTEIVFPSSLTRIDYGAFMDNNITKVTIGSGVYLEGSVFQNSDTFKTSYAAEGAGTYIYSGGVWVKQ